MRKIIVLLSVLLCLCLSAQALSLPGGSAGPVVLTQAGEITKEVIVLAEDEDLTLSQLPMDGIYFFYLDSEGRAQMVEIQWDLEDEALTQPGVHEVTGTPVLRDGMTLAEGFDGTVTWPVFRQGVGAVLQVVSTDPANIVDPLLPHHGDPETDLQLHTKVTTCFTKEGWLLDVKNREDFFWQWDLSLIDSSVLGRYSATATLHCPAWAVFPAEYQTVTETVYVLPTDRIELYAPVRTASNGNMEFQWLYASAHVTETVLERKNADEGWEACPNGWYSYQTDAINHTDMLYLTLTALPTETPLILRLRYQDVVNGEAVERITEPITLTVLADIAEQIAAANGRVIVDVFGGDRDGGDSDGMDLPDYEQPAPGWDIPVWEPEEEKADPVMETVTNTYTALSGARLDQLVQLSATVLFEKQGVAVEIPAPLLDELDLAADQLLKVTIIRPADNAVALEVLADGEAVTDLTGTVVRLPWEADGTTQWQVLDLSGAVIGTAVPEDTGTVSFVIDHPGTYWIQAVTAVQDVTVPETAAPEAPAEESPKPAETPKPAEPEELPVEEIPLEQPDPEEEPPAVQEAAPAGQPLPEAPEPESLLWPWLLGLLLLAVLGAYGWRRWRHG